MFISLKKYIREIKMKYTTIIVLDDFWDNEIYLIDLEEVNDHV